MEVKGGVVLRAGAGVVVLGVVIVVLVVPGVVVLGAGVVVLGVVIVVLVVLGVVVLVVVLLVVLEASDSLCSASSSSTIGFHS